MTLAMAARHLVPFLHPHELVSLGMAFPDLSPDLGTKAAVRMLLVPDDVPRLHKNRQRCAREGWVLVTRESMAAVLAIEGLTVDLVVWGMLDAIAPSKSMLFGDFLSLVTSVHFMHSYSSVPDETGPSALMRRMPRLERVRCVGLQHAERRIVIVLPLHVRDVRVQTSHLDLRGGAGVTSVRFDFVPVFLQPSGSIQVLDIDLSGRFCHDGKDCPLHELALCVRHLPALKEVHLHVSDDCLPHQNCPAVALPAHVDLCVTPNGRRYVRGILWRGDLGPYWEVLKRKSVGYLAAG